MVGFRAALTTQHQDPDRAPAEGSLLAALTRRPTQPVGDALPAPLPMKVQTGGTEITNVLALVLAGQVEEALQRLQVFLEDVLSEVGLDPAQADSFRQFLASRLGQAAKAGLLFPDWLRAFAREQLQLDDLPFCPPLAGWKEIADRATMIQVKSATNQTEPIRQLLKDALDTRVKSLRGLRVLRDENPNYQTIPEPVFEHLAKRLEAERKGLDKLFGLN